MENTPDIVLFFGRFHPLVVHLPIGFLVLAIVAELISRSSKFIHIQPATRFMWLLGFSSAFIAAIFGYLLSLGGGYDESTLFWHQWGGISITIISLIFYLGKGHNRLVNKIINKQVYSMMVVICFVLLMITGHLGGNLTHGSEYLIHYAPQPIRTLAGLPERKSAKRRLITSLDSADIFHDVLMPIFETKCISCHNADKKKGELILTGFSKIMEGGESGSIVKPGSPMTSELFRRISLPHDHEDIMPSDGKKPLSQEHIALIEWWIELGAEANGTISTLAPDDSMKDMLTIFFGLDRSEPAIPAAPPIDIETYQMLIAQGLIINELAEKSNLLEANLSITGKMINDIDLSLLLKLKEQLIWMQLANTNTTDQDMQAIGQLTELRKLNLSQNKLTDQGIQEIIGLSKLEVLNLYGNHITDSSITMLSNLEALKKLYVWKTEISPEMVELLRINNPDLEVVFEEPVL